MREYVKLANDPTFYLVDGNGPARPISSQAEMHRIGMLPVRIVSETELAQLRAVESQPAAADASESDAPRVVIDPSDGIDDVEATAASLALRQRKAQRKAAGEAE